MSSADLYGKEVIVKDKFIYPALFPNYTKAGGFSIKSIYKLGPLFSLGGIVDNRIIRNWQSSQYDDFRGSRSGIFALSLTFRIHNRYNNLGVWNRLKVFGEAGPVIGISRLKFESPSLQISNRSNLISTLLSISERLFGIKAGTGIEYNLNKYCGFYFDFSFHYYEIGSELYLDNYIAFSQVSYGVVIRLLKDKRFYYIK
ncbi:MAG TPA: hypothetical protein VI583_01900 [Cyclobacteriaceae bacterium]|nr:hypothetical protein [Cyclobacteriaceae bacterium]